MSSNEGALLQPVFIPRGEVINIGKFKIPKTDSFKHEIQPLAFLNIKKSDNSYISTCIHLRLDGYGKTEDEADKNMISKASYFLSQNFEKLAEEDAWDNIMDLFKCDDWSSELWDAYHKTQIRLSRKGNLMTDNAAVFFTRLIQILDWEKNLVAREKALLAREKELGGLKKELKIREEEIGVKEKDLNNRVKIIEEWKEDISNWANELKIVEQVNSAMAYYLIGKIKSIGIT